MTISTVLRAIAATTIVAGGLTLGIAGQVQALTIIDTSTSPTWNRKYGQSPFGQPGIATFGQTFTVPVNYDTVLSSFTFFVGKQTSQAGSASVKFNAYVMAWDGSRATGSILYQSGKQEASAIEDYEAFDFMTGGLRLLGGQQYVAFISSSNYPTSGLGNVGSPTVPTDPLLPINVYSGGQFVFLNNGTDFKAITATSWGTKANLDLAFKATFTSIPTPTLVPALLGIGTALLRRLKSELVEESNEE